MKKSRNIGPVKTWPSRGSRGVFVASIKDDDAGKVDQLLQYSQRPTEYRVVDSAAIAASHDQIKEACRAMLSDEFFRRLCGVL
jgi:hypothetical protein